jgi:diguanylate cyclase (GGDEF)-like protein
MRLEKEWADSSRTRGPLATIILDIDHFKAVNDNYGHDIGDAMLWSTAQAINRSLRRGDTCARIGGEEFLVICPNTTLEGAKQLAERIRVAVEENEVTRPGFTGSVTVSLGVGYRAQGILSIDQLIKMADNAVYQAKRSGRNCVVAGYPEDRRQSA